MHSPSSRSLQSLVGLPVELSHRSILERRKVRLCAAKGSRHGRITWPQRGPVIGLQNGQIEHISLNLLRTVCGLRGVAPHLTCTNVSIQTLKRNSTTSPSCMT